MMTRGTEQEAQIRRDRYDGRRLLLAACALALTGCLNTKRMNMMSTPLLHQYVGEQAYAAEAGERSPSLTHFYVTNRLGSGDTEERSFGNGQASELDVGTVTVRRGDRALRWEDLVKLTTQEDRHKKIPLRIESVRGMGTLGGEGAAEFARAVNKALAAGSGDEITLFVPGAQSTFYKGVAHATQLYHFMAERGVFVTFSWPSTGRLIRYSKDVGFAGDSVGDLERTIEWLANKTAASRINIFAYSAGAQIAAPALASLARQHGADFGPKLRIGRVYFGAPDVSAEGFFTDYLPAFRDHVEHTAFTYDRYDILLKVAGMAPGGPRLGRIDGTEPDSVGAGWLREANAHPRVEAIDMDFSRYKRPERFHTHGTWYRNPWVGSDAILFLLHGDSPDARGLGEKPDGTGWYFSVTYPDHLKRLTEREGIGSRLRKRLLRTGAEQSDASARGDAL